MLYKATVIVSVSYKITGTELAYATEHITLMIPHSVYHLRSLSRIHLRNCACFCP